MAASWSTIVSFDVRDPANPSILGSSGVDHGIHHMALDGGTLLVVGSRSGEEDGRIALLRAFDGSSPGKPGIQTYDPER